MKKLDWSEAPDWATHYGERHSLLECNKGLWFDDRGYTYQNGCFPKYSFGGPNHVNNVYYTDLKSMTPRPTEPKQCLKFIPLVGTICNLGKGTVQILGRNGKYVWWKNTTSNVCKSSIESCVEFKPLDTRTNKQKLIDELKAFDSKEKPEDEVFGYYGLLADKIMSNGFHGVTFTGDK